MRKTLLHSIRGWLIGTALLVLMASGHAFAQTQVTGTITVPEGGKVDATLVTATNPDNKVFRATADASGKYTLTIEPGTYTITANSPGMAPQVTENVQVADGQSVTQDVTLAAATPFAIPRAAAPIALTEAFDSAAFQGATEIAITSGANIVEGIDQVANWRGPATAGGRVKMMFSDQALHIAANLTFAKPNTNFGSDAELWKGNSFEIIFQNDAYNATRTAPDPAHNFRVVLGMGEQPRLRFGINLDQGLSAEMNLTDIVSVQNNADNTGNLVRLNIPWSLLGNQAPADAAQAAMDLIVNNSTAEATAEAPARQFSLSWAGLPGTPTNPSALRPVQFAAAQ